MTRDLRLDVWRGLCLVDVVLVHLAYNEVGFPEVLDALVKDYTRFAAGGFVFLSGLTIGVVFRRRLAGSWADRLTVYRWCLRRAAALVLVDLLASVGLLLLDGVRRFPVMDGAPIGDAVRELLLFERPGISGGILLLYAILLGVLPAVLELRRWVGSGAVVALSLSAYTLAQWSVPLRWPGNAFPIAWWQPLFIAGLLSNDRYLRTHDAGRRQLAAWAMVALAGFAVVFLLQHGPRLGPAFAAHVPSLDFTKTPLRPGALLWYLAIVQLLLAATSLYWRQILALVPGVACLALLGRHSLLAYVAHVFTEILVLEYVWSTWPAVALRMGAAAADLAALVLLCATVERWPGAVLATQRAVTRFALTLRRWTPRPAIVLVGAVLVSAGVWSLRAQRLRVLETAVGPAILEAPTAGTPNDAASDASADWAGTVDES